MASATDPDRAERIANSITSKDDKISALSSVAVALAATDPDRATRLFTDAERIASSFTNRYPNDEAALRGVAKALASASLVGARSLGAGG